MLHPVVHTDRIMLGKDTTMKVTANHTGIRSASL